jgi:VIT1/CCC1 family predicted Fe2+/Mn2+ transporter
MDTNTEIQLRLRFYKEVAENLESVRLKFENYKKSDHQECQLKTKHNHIWMDVLESKREYWSPHLHLELERNEDGSTHIRGLFGPEPTLWTLFMFLHFIVAGIFTIFGVIAYSNYTLKLPITIDLMVMLLMVIVWFLLYFIAKQIRSRATEQRNELETKFLEILESQEHTI